MLITVAIIAEVEEPERHRRQRHARQLGNANTGSFRCGSTRARVHAGRGGEEVEHDPERDRPQHAVAARRADRAPRNARCQKPGSTSVESAMKYQTTIACGGLPPFQVKCEAGSERCEEPEPAVPRDQEREHAR